jgi:hypothetical protein
MDKRSLDFATSPEELSRRFMHQRHHESKCNRLHCW